jgi:hypothetical protein
MFRSIIGFAILAIVAWLALKLILGLIGGLMGIATTVLVLAVFGFFIYMALRVLSPATADRVRDMIKGRPSES